MTSEHAFANDPAGKPPQVLLVDDDEVSLLLTALALRERGFDVTESGGGEHALQLLASWAPDVVVLDAMMPGLDGFATCARLRAMPGYENVPVLMLTGLDDDASITRAYQAGATDFFVKANQWSLLAGRLQYLLRASRTRIELERSQAKLARAQDLARMGSFDWRRGGARSGGSVLLSAQGLRVLGCHDNAPLGLRAILRLVQRSERRAVLRLLRESMRHNAVLATDVPVALHDGRQRIIHIEAEPEFNEHGHGVGYTGIVQDVTDRRVAEDRIRHLANFDSLTSLPNRRQLVWRMERAIEHARRLGHPCAFLLIDLDRFKIVNDTLGHAAGDELLMEVAQRLRACVRHNDQVMEGTLEAAGSRAHRSLEAVGRLGGDEFIALLPEIGDERDAQRVADRILEVMRDPVLVGGQECFVTASVGIAIFPRDGGSVADLMRNSDVAMYSVKSQGKDSSAIYSPQLAGRGREKLELESALHKAIERDE
ncbi:MAG TPA: diguanylate cyclase, partial [Rubrivivax sp.]|nr:diguanylate cyclase [Rubrivivax sp.]